MAGAVDYSQFKGKPFQVISKLGVRYTGIFDHISQEDQTICLAQVYNHGTEDRPTARKLAGSSTTLGWVRFHTESIESLALVENYVPPGQEEPIDPILASVSQSAPGAPGPSQPPAQPSPPAPPASSSRSPSISAASQRHDLPPKPSGAAISAATALDRVQASLQDLSVDSGSGSRQPPRRRGPPPAQAIEVPDAEFDFAAGTQAFEKERESRRNAPEEGGAEDVGEPDHPPHPAAMSPRAESEDGSLEPANGGQPAGPGGKKVSSVYNKGSFFDGLSGESSRISRNEERTRNYDTFGEAGGSDQYGNGAGGYGGRGRGGPPRGGGGGHRGGYNQGQGGGGYGRPQGAYGSGGRGRGGPRGGYGQPQRQGFEES